MISIESYVQQGKSVLSRWMLDSRWKTVGRGAAYVLGGFCLSAGSLEHGALPLAMSFLFGCSGWSAVLAAVGGSVGYLLFWGSYAFQPLLWLGISLPVVLLLGNHRLTKDCPLLLPACAMLVVAGSGLAFQLLARDTTPVLLYLIRVGLAGGCSWLFHRLLNIRSPTLQWIAIGLGIFSLAQILPASWLGLGYIAAGAMAATGAFPGAAVAGLALDLAQVTKVPMTAVIVLAALLRLLPRATPWLSRLAPGILGLVFMRLTGIWDLKILPGLFIGGLLSMFLPGPGQAVRRRGETGAAQVRLELAAGVLHQTQLVLSDTTLPDIDRQALILRAADRACGNCPCREDCQDREALSTLPGELLDKPLLDILDCPIVCRKSSRLLDELHRAQEQLRVLRADRQRRREYQGALTQQYGFLSQYLQALSDGLSQRCPAYNLIFDVEASVYGNRPAESNGDRHACFSGPGGHYFVLLCDGMGTGPGAAAEGNTAAGILRRLLSAGFPPEHALRSLNSLCALRELPGAVTADLLDIRLDTGKAKLYKWGAAPSFLITHLGAQRIGTVGPPPGYSVSEVQERSYPLTLRPEQVLLMVSDGVDGEAALSICAELAGGSVAEMGTQLLQYCHSQGEDDATVIAVRLKRA